MMMCDINLSYLLCIRSSLLEFSKGLFLLVPDVARLVVVEVAQVAVRLSTPRGGQQGPVVREI